MILTTCIEVKLIATVSPKLHNCHKIHLKLAKKYGFVICLPFWSLIRRKQSLFCILSEIIDASYFCWRKFESKLVREYVIKDTILTLDIIKLTNIATS